MTDALAIRHVAFEDMGTFSSVLSEYGIDLQYMDAGIDRLDRIDPHGPDLLVVLGGPIGADAEQHYPFILDELKLLECRLEAGLPTLGICLGAQLMARALGSRVYPGAAGEIGWQPLTLTQAGLDSCLKHLDGGRTAMLHWHGDTFDLPMGASLLASTDLCRNQVYSWGRSALAFQCHPEIQGASFERWLIGHANEIAANGLSVSTLRADTARLGGILEAQSAMCFSAWLEKAGLRPGQLE
ncbi:glutamine amidotransferase [Candidatus Methylospira mobilis]|uniref:Glutamine amidotransferase n=1 Tax=Candidatus Methylospira mobilis TaxID=1808979 RepID=A0A5Q0BDP5_9GAMM|nr:glutamine amidotransferase [Candidatus Methylospira mobilis]QFY41659.1 glutamine amidotransferase [Candidatus Methylospira mobilis]WNV05088.1 glutamine amidotransferase [Candidatus Methylospira mobilis]